MSLNRTVQWIDKTEGRDKFCKAIQYACRFLKHHATKRGDKDAAVKFDSLFSHMRDARKLFRLFKTVNEIKKILDFLHAKGPMTSDTILNILVRLAFAGYWLFDNLSILAKIKIIGLDAKKMGQVGASFWLTALFINLVSIAKDIVVNLKYIDRLQRSYNSASEEKDVQQKRNLFLKAQRKMLDLGLNALKVVGDIIPAGQASEFFPKILKWNATDSACGMGGFISAIISSYQLYD